MSVFSFRLFDHWSQNSAADRLGSALFHFVWQGAGIAAMAWLAVFLLRRARPQVRYGVLVVALGVMCVCPAVTFVVSKPEIGAVAATTRRAEVIDPTESEVASISMDRSSVFDRGEPETKAALVEVSVRETASRIPESPTARQQPVEPGSVATRAIALNAWLTDTQAWLERHRHDFVAAWGGGVLLLTLRLAAGLFGAERVRRRQVVTARESLQQMTGKLIARMGIQRSVRVLESALAEVPALVGWMRPVILLPAGALCGLTPTQLESLLAHELAHVRRHDYLVNLWQTVVETILFYHPAVWWISRRIREEREHCCDDVVVGLCGDRIAYARALATMEEMRSPVPRWAIAAGGGSLAARIRRIVGQSETAANRRPTAGALVVLALLTISATATITLRRNVAANEPKGGAEPQREDMSNAPAADESNTKAAKALRAVLDHNRPWLDRGVAGAGWQPTFKTLSYSYHRPLEGDREQVVLSSAGEAVLEVTREANSRNRDRLGDRFIALNSGEHALAKRGGSLAWIRARLEQADSVIARHQPFDHSLQQCARLGTQLDLPLFHWGPYVDTSRLDVSDGEWKGVPCHVVTAPFPNPNFRVGSESPHDDRAWRHRSPDKEVFYIDSQRHVVLHETLTQRMKFDPDLHFEIDFLDYVEVVPGQWAPLAINVVLPEFFTARYQFQIVGKTHWMLKEVTSWYEFDRDKSCGIVENIRVDGDASILDEALKQVAATRQAPARDVQETIAGLKGPERREMPPSEIIRLKRTRADHEGRFTVTFDNSQDSSDTRRWVLDPAIHQAVFQLVIYDHKFGRAEKKMLQIPAREEGGYHVDLRMDADLIESSQLSVWFVTLQPDQDAFVKRFIEEGKGGRYRGILRTSGARLSDMPIDETVTGWIRGRDNVRLEIDRSRVAANAEEVPAVPTEPPFPATESRTTAEPAASETELQPAMAPKPDEGAGKRALLAVLDHNRSWLDPETPPPGGKQLFETLSYSFHTVREDVRESCAFNSKGESVIEVSYDGQGKMKDRVGARFVGLNASEYASANRGGKFALIHSPPERSRDRPFGESLRHFARIGCQFDLPLFRYRDELESAKVEMSDGEWKGKPCQVVTVTGLRPNVYLGCGTMLGHTSWSYVHHVRPSREVFYVDPHRHVVLHETLDWSRRDSEKKFEIDFPEYTEISPGQWAPLVIRAESPGYFTCEYRFQVVAGSHWLLKEVVSWFDPNEKSRGVVEEVQVNGGRELLDDGLRQVSASRALFGGKESSGEPVSLSTVPFVLNDVVHVGPYDLQVVRSERWQVAVRVSTRDRQAPARVPIGVLDPNGRLLFAPTVTLADVDGKRSGEVELHGSLVWNDARSLIVPVSQEGATAPQPVQTIPFRWNEPMSVNIPEVGKGRIRSEFRETKPRDARTCVHRIEIVRKEDGTARAILDVASIDGPHEFYFDLSVAVVGETGTLLASGNQSGTLRVESRPVEQRYEVDLGPIPEGSNPRYLVVGVAPGNIIRAPAGSHWVTFEQTPPFDVASKPSGRRRSQNREEVRAGEKTNLKRTRPDAEGRFTITFDNPLSRGDTKRWTLDPEQNQVIFQVSVSNGDGKLQEKIFKQLPARKQGGYRVDVHVKPELIEHSQASVVFVTIQPDHDAWVKRFFHEGQGTSYKGIWSGDSSKLPDMAVDETTTGWLADGENPAAPAAEGTTATSSRKSEAAKSPTATEILQMLVDKNRFWLDPQPKNLSYTVIGGKPGAESAREVTNRVRIAGEKVRWDLDTDFEPPPNSKRKPDPMNYTYVFTPDGTVCLRAPPKVDKDVLRRKRGTHALRQGMLFATALHVMALHGIPQTCRIVEEKPGADGRVVVIEGEFRNARGAFGLGMDHVQLGKIDWRIDQFRVQVRLPDAVPIKEEYFDPTTGALTAMSVAFGPETLKIGDHVAPATARFMSNRDVPAGRAGGFKKWILEAHFQNVEGNWLLEKATNSQDGVVVKQLQVTDVSTAPVPPEVFETPQAAAEEEKE